ncbi:hypothetical protein L7F22_034586 [Adiantum nelumboides]|nr:hypothetical protein [Adiantum nelumboides]
MGLGAAVPAGFGAASQGKVEGRQPSQVSKRFSMASFGVLAFEGRRVPSNLTKLKQRTLFESYGKERSQEKNSRSKETTNQMLHEIFGSSSVCEDHDDDIEMEESGNVLQADMELFGMPLYNPPPSNVQENASNVVKKKKKRKFRAEWSHKFSFLKLLVIEDKEFMKCVWCEKYQQKGPWGKGKGCKTIQISAIRKHKRSPEHRFAQLKTLHEGGIKLKEHMQVLGSKNQRRVITCMKLMYFVAREDLACKKYKKLCDLAYALDVESMPVRNDYSSYTNVMAGKDFAFCISEYVHAMQMKEVKQGPFYSLMIDESTDRSVEKHMIVYISFLFGAGLGVFKTQFARLVIVADGTAQTKYDALKKVLAEIGLDVHHMIHDIRWLSRGKVMERLVALMPAILTFWKEGALAWYKKLCIYKVLFIIHLLADVLYDLNVLSKHFQEEEVDIACISAYIEVTMSSLRRKFLEEDFGKGTEYLKQFMADVETGSWIYTNESGEVYIHELEYAKIPGKDKRGMFIDCGDGDVESCKQLARSFVQTLIDCLNERFPDVYFLNTKKLFSPQFYPKDTKRSKCSEEREKKANDWLNRLLKKVGGHLVDAQGCRDEVLSFTDTLYYACESMCMKDAWQLFASNANWQHTYPNLLKLWQLILLLPISSVSCERGFSKQNIISRQCLKVETLEMLMRISLVGPKTDAIDWVSVYKLWELKKSRKATDA